LYIRTQNKPTDSVPLRNRSILVLLEDVSEVRERSQLPRVDIESVL
jgi:hypothetical protein